MASIRFEQVSKRFGSTTAVDGLNLEVADGEFLVLVGPSGCGKSTALRMLAGLEEVTEGSIWIDGRVVNNLRPRDRDIAMVFQSYALYPHMSVRDNIAFALKLRKVPKDEIERRVRETSSILGIDGLLKRKPSELSGGQRQRVALGRAIVREPAAFLLDEPLSNLDAQLRVQTRGEIRKLHERLGSTFVYVTHDQVEAMTMADRIAVLDKGVLQQAGTPRDLYECPANLFVATFIGSPAMNLLSGLVKERGGDLVAEAGGVSVPVRDGQATPGENVVLGIRPENLHHPDLRPAGVQGVRLKAEITLVEAMGSETYLYLTTLDGQRLIARVDPRIQTRAGETFEVLLDIDRVHLFDAGSGRRLTAPGGKSETPGIAA